MSSHRDLADRADPRDLDKASSPARQAQQGERPDTPADAAGAAVSRKPSTGAPRAAPAATDPERDQTPFRPRDEGGATPTR